MSSLPRVILFLVFSCSLPVSLFAAEASVPPNVILIVADDLGWRDLGCMGSEFYESPRIDGLAKSGMTFTNAYATCPVCSPSRASLMTGKYPARLGLTAHIGAPQPHQWKRDTPLKPASYAGNLPLSEVTLAERFHDAGYATFHAGKWHLGGQRHWPDYQGFDQNVGGWSQGGPFGGKQYFSPYGNPRIADGPEGEHLPDRLASETNRFIESHKHKPFFIHLSFYSVHVPLVAREDLLKKYRAKLEQLKPIDSELTETVDGLERTRHDLPVYAAMIEGMDLAVGRVLDKLEQAELSDNTIIMFTSDNGGLSTGDIAISKEEGWPTTNAPLRAGKGWLYEGGIRVPLLCKVPGVTKPGTSSEYPVTGTDFNPTLLELAGVNSGSSQTNAAEESIDGKSFVAALNAADDGESSDNVTAARGPIFWHYPHYGNQGGRPGSAVRDGDWKLIEWYTLDGKGQLELYNLKKDLGELTNLAESHAEKCDHLHNVLARWRQAMDAKMPTPQGTKN